MNEQDIDWSQYYDQPTNNSIQEQDIDWTQYYDEPETKGWKGVTQDIGSGTKQFATNISSFLADPARRLDIAQALGSELSGAGNQIANDKGRVLQNMGTGALQAARGIYNTPSNVADYLARKEIIPSEYEGSLGRIPEDFDYAQSLGIKGEKGGDKFIRTMTEIMPYLMGGEAGLAGKGAGFLRKNAQRSAAMGAHAIGQNENPIPSMLAYPTAELGLKAASGALKGAAKVAKGTTQTAKNVVNAVSPTKIAKKVITDRANIRNDYKNYYKDLFSEAEQQGINKIKVPKLNAKSILENSTSKESKALEEFLREPSLKNAHSAQSDLGKIIRRLDKTNENVGLPTDKLRALESARQAQKKIKGSMFDAFNKNSPELANKYGKITEGYAKDVIPYTKSKPINTYKKGELTEKDFVNALMKDKKFKKQLGAKYPELKTREILEKLGKYGLVGSSGLGAIKLIKGLYF